MLVIVLTGIYRGIVMKNARIAVLYLVFIVSFILSLAAGSQRALGSDDGKVSEARNGVVRIFVEGPGIVSYGTGFGVGTEGEDADTFVTNWHVVTCSGSFDYKDVKVYILLDDETYFEYEYLPVAEGEAIDENEEYVEAEDGTLRRKVLAGISMGDAVECEVLYAEKQYPDIAVLRTKEPVDSVETMPLRPVDTDSIGKKIFAIGFPGTADTASSVYAGDSEIQKLKASIENVSVTGGVISRCSRLEAFGDTDCITHDAHINHGNSGGPLVLEDGSVIGINTYGYGENASEYSVSIYIDYAIEVLEDLGISFTEAGDVETKAAPPMGIVAIAAGAVMVIAVILLKRKGNGVQSNAAGMGRAAGQSGQGAGYVPPLSPVLNSEQRQTAFAGDSAPRPAIAGDHAPQAAIAGNHAPQPAIAGNAGNYTPQAGNAGNYAPQAGNAGNRAPQPGNAASQQAFRIQGQEGIFAGRRFALEGEVRIGRDPSRCDLIYPAEARKVSRMHCIIRVQNGNVSITDLKSSYGTFVNGKRLMPERTYLLSVGDNVFIASKDERLQITRKGGVV